MAIIGFLASLLILLYATLGIGFAIFHGGEEFSRIKLTKEWTWVVPALLILGWLWYLLITNSPFSITLN